MVSSDSATAESFWISTRRRTSRVEKTSFWWEIWWEI